MILWLNKKLYAAEFGLDRFCAGRFVDESVAAGVAH